MHEYGVMGDGHGTAYGDDTCTEYILKKNTQQINFNKFQNYILHSELSYMHLIKISITINFYHYCL